MFIAPILVTDEDIGLVSIIISESCSNVVKYACNGRKIYTISMQYCAERAAVGISDTGRGYIAENFTVSPRDRSADMGSP